MSYNGQLYYFFLSFFINYFFTYLFIYLFIIYYVLIFLLPLQMSVLLVFIYFSVCSCFQKKGYFVHSYIYFCRCLVIKMYILFAANVLTYLCIFFPAIQKHLNI